MHTFEKHGIIFFHEGDFSGEVQIADDVGHNIKVPTSAVIAFVAEWVRQKKMIALERAPDRVILGLRVLDVGDKE